jgi:hypothetical protein
MVFAEAFALDRQIHAGAALPSQFRFPYVLRASNAAVGAALRRFQGNT